MRVLNILCSGQNGGIERLCNNLNDYNDIDNYWLFLIPAGYNYEMIKNKSKEKVFSLDKYTYNYKKLTNIILSICNRENIDIISFQHDLLVCNQVIVEIKNKYKTNVKIVKFAHEEFKSKIGFNIKKAVLRPFSFFYKKKACEAADLVIAVSKYIEDDYKHYAKGIKKITTIYNGIPKTFYNKVKKYRNNKEIIFVGRLVLQKGINYIIKSINILKDKYPDIHLTIVGDGCERERLVKLTKQLKLEKYIRFMGNQNDVIEYLDTSSIFVYSSIVNEAFGISVVEAMARRCIPVVFDKGGLNEIVSNNYNGIVCKEISTEALSRSIEEAFKYPNLAEAAYRTSQNFSLDETNKTLYKEFGKLEENV